MTSTSSGVIGGVDTHKHTHHASAIDGTGQLLGHRQFAATDRGHRELCGWLESLGDVVAVGVEGTSSYGTALTRVLAERRHKVIEVNRPNRSARRNDGKSDQLDSEQAARAVLAATATALPKSKSGPVEVLRMLRIARSTAVKSRTQAFNALHAIAVGAPQPLRDELLTLTKRGLVNRCAGLRPETTSMLELLHEPQRLLLAGTKTSLRDLAERFRLLDAEVKRLSKTITELVTAVAPDLVSLIGVGPEIAGQLLMTAGDNPDRVANEASFAKLCGVAPQPASSGKTTGRHRLSRGGDRAANSALYIVTVTRMRHHEPTRAYVERRTAEGLSKREIMRCLKRYIAREVFNALPNKPQIAELPRAA